MGDPSYSKHLIDPELRPGLEAMPQFEFNAETLPAIRDAMGGFASEEIELAVVPVEMVTEGPDGPVEILWFDPSPGEVGRPAILHIHGGGMIVGSARQLPQAAANLAASLGVPVASVEYRLAPEASFPGPQEDCYAALEWLASGAQELGIDPSRIGISGESAGGGLAASVALMARDRGGPELCAQILVYPMLDHRVGGPDDPWRNRSTGEFVWSRESNQFGWNALRGGYSADDDRKGWFSPSLAEDLSGLPPTWIGVGNLDLFFDEDLDYARRLVDAGVPVELHAYPGAFHGFDFAAGARIVEAFSKDRLSGSARLLGLSAKP